MGKTFCVAGLVAEGSEWRTVRPMPITLHGATQHASAVRHVGWFPSQLELLERWDIVQLVGLQPADIERPHTEDVWVTAMGITGRSIASDRRSAMLRGTVVPGYRPHFGVPLLHTRTSAYLKPGMGDRSLVTIAVRTSELFFEASSREGAGEADIRVRFNVPGVGVKQLPVKDHCLLVQAERQSGTEPRAIAKFLEQSVTKMSSMVAVRLGLSRGFDVGRGERRCWLMADGFFPMEEIGT